MAVRDDRRVVLADVRPDLVGCLRHARPREERRDLHVLRARNVALARVAGIAASARELVVPANVEDQRSAVRDFPPAGHGLRPRDELGPALLDLDLGRLHLAGPRRETADENRDVRVAAHLRDLESRRRVRQVAAVVENEPLLSGHSVAPEPKGRLGGEVPSHLRARKLPWRADHHRDRARDVAAGVRVRAADVRDQYVLLARVLGEPGCVDENVHEASAATTPASCATAGRSSSSPSQDSIAGYGDRSKPSMSRARSTHGRYAMSASVYGRGPRATYWSSLPMQCESHSSPFSSPRRIE